MILVYFTPSTSSARGIYNSWAVAACNGSEVMALQGSALFCVSTRGSIRDAVELAKKEGRDVDEAAKAAKNEAGLCYLLGLVGGGVAVGTAGTGLLGVAVITPAFAHGVSAGSIATAAPCIASDFVVALAAGISVVLFGNGIYRGCHEQRFDPTSQIKKYKAVVGQQFDKFVKELVDDTGDVILTSNLEQFHILEAMYNCAVTRGEFAAHFNEDTEYTYTGVHAFLKVPGPGEDAQDRQFSADMIVEREA